MSMVPDNSLDIRLPQLIETGKPILLLFLILSTLSLGSSGVSDPEIGDGDRFLSYSFVPF